MPDLLRLPSPSPSSPSSRMSSVHSFSSNSVSSSAGRLRPLAKGAGPVQRRGSPLVGPRTPALSALASSRLGHTLTYDAVPTLPSPASSWFSGGSVDAPTPSVRVPSLCGGHRQWVWEKQSE